MRPPLLVVLLALAPACVRLSYDRNVELREPAGAQLEQLVPGEADLTELLDRLGAPLAVYELADGAAVSYGWSKGQRWRLQASVPVTGDVSGRFSFTDTGQNIPGILCLFDADWTLTEIRRGNLRELTSRLGRRRPQLVEDDA